MPMIRTMPILCLLLLAGCSGAYLDPGITGPTGRASDAGKLSPVTVRDVWKADISGKTRAAVAQQLPLGGTADFDPAMRFEGFYDSVQNVTNIGVYGDVTTHTDYGTVMKNGYYAVWQQPGRLKSDFPAAPWRLLDVEILDQQF